jgi:hypothetical protein
MNISRLLRGMSEPLQADNDPVTVGHADANALFADLLRTKQDVFAAEHAATEACSHLEQARLDHVRAWERMQKLFIENDLNDPPMPTQETGEP